jgi:uncharacterized protein (TIGR02145 family)
VAEYATASSITFTGTPPFDLVLSTGGQISVQTGYELVGSQTLDSFTDKTGAPGIIPGTNQPQGGCTFTQPPVVGTFASFPSNYSASTFVTLTDERDNKNYAVVKIGDRWWMAQNLNYQKDLTWQTASNMPSIGQGSNPALIGHFWCPGGYSSSTGTSTIASCNVWGALYSWETAMMVDGKWSDDSRNTTNWVEPAYSTYTSAANTNNGGRGANGHGICPPNWHVPTDGEWGDVLNTMETGSKVHNTSSGWIGTDAGSRGKSKCTVADQQPSGPNYVSDTQANWYYYASTLGTDNYKFRILPSGIRQHDGSIFRYRGTIAGFWSSSASTATNAWRLRIDASLSNVNRSDVARAGGFSVRCIRD